MGCAIRKQSQPSTAENYYSSATIDLYKSQRSIKYIPNKIPILESINQSTIKRRRKYLAKN